MTAMVTSRTRGDGIGWSREEREVRFMGVLGLRVAPTLDGVKFEPVAVRFFDVEHFDVDRMPDQIARPFQSAFVRIEFVRSNCGRLDVFVSGP
jgi:hypothetical protein